MKYTHKQTVSFRDDRAMRNKEIRLGYEGDNMVERLEFILPEIAQSQTATLLITGADAVKLDKADNGRYAVDLTRDMIGPDGEREAYVRIDGAGGKVWQSAPMRLITGALPDVEEEIEKVYPTAVGQMLTAMAEHTGEMAAQEERVEQAADRAEEAAKRAENATVSGAVTSVNGKQGAVTLNAADVGAVSTTQLPQAIDTALAQAKESGDFDGPAGPKGETGKDGGYYQPSVTDGVLTWTPSKGDMPSVPASDVRGPAGQDGQPGKDGKDGQPGSPGKTAYQYAQDGGYTGTEAEFAAKLAEEIPEPYTLPAATADTLGGMKVGSGLRADESGRVSVDLHEKPKLIKSITVEEEVSAITIDGFSAKNIMVEYIIQPAKVDAPVFIYINDVDSINCLDAITTKMAHIIFCANTLMGKIGVTDVFHTTMERFAVEKSVLRYGNGMYITPAEAITKIKSYANTTNGVFPAGTEINVYEVNGYA